MLRSDTDTFPARPLFYMAANTYITVIIINVRQSQVYSAAFLHSQLYLLHSQNFSLPIENHQKNLSSLQTTSWTPFTVLQPIDIGESV